MDGYEVARRIRANEAMSKTISGRDDRVTGRPRTGRVRSTAGFALHLVKPVEPEALQRALIAVARPPQNA